MPKKAQSPKIYKTESQLKEEAQVKHAAEAEAEALAHKSELQKKRENYWYHYKWHTIGGLVAAFLLVFFIKDMFFRTLPDTSIVVVSGSYVSDDALESMTTALQEFATDFNSDGKIVVAYDFISLPAFANEAAQEAPAVPDLTGGQQDMGNAMKLMTVIAANSDPIYLLDEAAYDYITGIGQDENPSEDERIFEAFSVPADTKKLDYEGAAELNGMRFYLRSNYSDNAYFEYCKQLLLAIDGE